MSEIGVGLVDYQLMARALERVSPVHAANNDRVVHRTP